MTVKILTKRASASGKVPTDLVAGEVAIDPYLGKLWYRNNDNSHQCVSQQVHIAPTSNVPQSPQEGLFWYENGPQQHQLKLYTDGGWEDIGLGRDGGEIHGHVTIRDVSDGNIYFQTTEIIPGTETDPKKGIYTFGKLRADGDLYVGGNGVLNGAVSMNSTVAISGAVTMDSSLTVGGLTELTGARRKSAGGYYYNVAAGSSSARVTISTANPSGGSNGDLWFKVT